MPYGMWLASARRRVDMIGWQEGVTYRRARTCKGSRVSFLISKSSRRESLSRAVTA